MENTENSKVILNLLMVTAVFCAIMGAIGYVVTRYPELLDGASTMVDGVAVAVPNIVSTEPMTYRCRVSKEYVMDGNSSQVRTTALVTNCGHEPTASKN